MCVYVCMYIYIDAAAINSARLILDSFFDLLKLYELIFFTSFSCK